MATVDRVERIFWWEVTTVYAASWDSALVDADGALRPSFCGITKQDISKCPGNTKRDGC